MEWAIQTPLAGYALLALALGGCLYLVVTFKIEFERHRQERKALAVEVEFLGKRIGELSLRLDESEERAALAEPGGTTRPAFGGTTQYIAAALDVPACAPGHVPEPPVENERPGWETQLRAAIETQTAPLRAPAAPPPTAGAPRESLRTGGATPSPWAR